MNERELIEEFIYWLKSHFKDSDLLLDREVLLYLGEQPQNFRTDLVVVQSKSNVIHAFELKIKLIKDSINSTIWQVDSLYGNYKWLAIKEFEKSDSQFLSLLKKRGIGLISYEIDKKSFKIEIQPKYIDGNFLKFYPSIKEKWNNKLRHASKSRNKKKN